MIEQSLDLPCDVSPLDPRTMREAEIQKPGQNIEKLLLERVMLRKELRLRGVQELLVETSHKLEVAEKRLAEYEALPGWRAYTAWCALLRAASEAGSGGAGLVQSGLSAVTSAVHQVRTKQNMSMSQSPHRMLRLIDSQGFSTLQLHTSTRLDENIES